MSPRLPFPAVLVVVALGTGTAGAQSAALFSTSTNLVVMHATVKVSFFASDVGPVTVGLLVDNSGSMYANRDRVIAAAKAFAEASNPQDEIFVLAFNEHVRAALPQGSPFTSDIPTLREALARTLSTRGRTALFDAIADGMAYLKKGRHERNVLVVISDGGDNASRTTYAGAIAPGKPSLQVHPAHEVMLMIRRVLPMALVFALALGPLSGAAAVKSERAQPEQPGDRPLPLLLAPAEDVYPLKVQLMTLAQHLWSLGGLYVWVPNVRIDEVLSAQAFVIEPTHRFDRSGRALVVLGEPGATLEPDVTIELTGVTYTGASARRGAQVPAGIVSQDVADEFEHGPVIVADEIWMLGRVPVYSRRDAAAARRQ